MKTFKTLMLVTGFALLAACGGNNSEKFVGEWVDPTPKEESKGVGGLDIDFSNDIVIKANGSNKVEVTLNVFGREMKVIQDVDGENIIDEGRVIYTLDGDALVKAGSNIRLVRK